MAFHKQVSESQRKWRWTTIHENIESPVSTYEEFDVERARKLTEWKTMKDFAIVIIDRTLLCYFYIIPCEFPLLFENDEKGITNL